MIAYLLALLTMLVAALGDPWPTYRHDLNNTGTAPGPSQASFVHLRARWTFTADDRITSTPTVVGGIAYFGTFAGSVYAVDAERGRLLWRRNLGSNPAGIKPYGGPRGVLGSVAIADGLAYADSGSCLAAAFDARTGRERWRRTICSTKRYDDTYASPVVADGLVLLGISMISDEPTDSGREIALDARSGVLRWTMSARRYRGTGSGITTTPALDLDDGIGYIGSGNPTPMDAPPPGPDPGSDSVIAFDIKTGTTRWLYGPVNPHDAYDLDFLASVNRFQIGAGSARRWIVGEANKNGTYYALDALTGKLVWRNAMEPRSAWPLPLGTPAVGFGRIFVPIYVQDSEGWLVALRAADGSQLWRVKAAGMYEAPVLWGGVLFATEATGWLNAYRADNGRSLGRWFVGGWLTGRGPAVAGNRLYLATSQYLKVFDLSR